MLDLRQFASWLPVVLFSLCGFEATAQDKTRQPNIVLIFADDLGYGDLGCYGAKGWTTPRIDSLAAEGVRFTDFHSSQPVCSASRAAMLTGCYSNRIGLHDALFPNAKVSLHPDETTMAETLKSVGYATGMVGKWHLGDRLEALPNHHGFDYYYGLPYSNDMWPHGDTFPKGTFPPLPLYENGSVVDPDVRPEVQSQLTQEYSKKSIQFIRKHAGKEPFFLYFAHAFPHVPLYTSNDFIGSSKQGVYGDVMQEFDSAVGNILDELERLGQSKNTLVIFTSDNGPWSTYGEHAGSSGALREGKRTCFEGGIRVPMVARWPGSIPAGLVRNELTMTTDLLPTLASIASAPLPKRKIDGRNILHLLQGESSKGSDEQAVHYYYQNQNELQAVRKGTWKLMLPHRLDVMQGGTLGKDGMPGKSVSMRIEKPQLYDMASDQAEQQDLAEREPKRVQELLEIAEQARKDLGDSLTKVEGKNVREPKRW
jgi:arylsulfatase A